MATAMMEVEPETLEAMSLKERLRSGLREASARATERLVLTGFMGCGKSTVGPLVAAALGWTFVDLDALIETRTGKTVEGIFAEGGEADFRRKETAALVAALGEDRVVIALGGGAPETLGNRLLLEQTPKTVVVYLEAEFGVLEERCGSQAAMRPLFQEVVSARQRYKAREPLYRRLAHLKVEAGSRTAQETASAVVAAVAAGVRRA